MSVKRGDVVLLQTPMTRGRGTKLRPMLVIQNDANNGRMANTILAFITTNLARVAEPTQVLVDVATPDGLQSGLQRNSVVSCENLITTRQSDISITLGHLPFALMQQVDTALKVSLALP